MMGSQPYLYSKVKIFMSIRSITKTIKTSGYLSHIMKTSSELRSTLVVLREATLYLVTSATMVFLTLLEMLISIFLYPISKTRLSLGTYTKRVETGMFLYLARPTQPTSGKKEKTASTVLYPKGMWKKYHRQEGQDT